MLTHAWVSLIASWNYNQQLLHYYKHYSVFFFFFFFFLFSSFFNFVYGRRRPSAAKICGSRGTSNSTTVCADNFKRNFVVVHLWINTHPGQNMLSWRGVLEQTKAKVRVFIMLHLGELRAIQALVIKIRRCQPLGVTRITSNSCR